MFKVELHGGGYKITIGDGKHGGYTTREIDEVTLALLHYYDSQGRHRATGSTIVPKCPLCRAMQEAQHGKSD